jgi:hypothetical protein
MMWLRWGQGRQVDGKLKNGDQRGLLCLSHGSGVEVVSDHRDQDQLGDTGSIAYRRRQRVEVRLACKILNTMTRLGMPDSVKVE